MEGKKDNFCFQATLGNLAGNSQSIEFWHFNIQQRNIWAETFDEGQCHFSIRCFSNDFQAGVFLNAKSESFSHERMIVCYQNPNLITHGCLLFAGSLSSSLCPDRVWIAP